MILQVPKLVFSNYPNDPKAVHKNHSVSGSVAGSDYFNVRPGQDFFFFLSGPDTNLVYQHFFFECQGQAHCNSAIWGMIRGLS